MAQVRQVVSESLQATIRRLLPSQQGFTEDLQATNVITPIIDLTPTAEGSLVRQDLQTAMAFGSITDFRIRNTTTNLAASPGFWRVIGTINIYQGSGANEFGTLQIDDDGLAQKTVFEMGSVSASAGQDAGVPFDFVVFLRSGDTLQGVATSEVYLSGSYRQIADVNGVFVNPSGFSAS